MGVLKTERYGMARGRPTLILAMLLTASCPVAGAEAGAEASVGAGGEAGAEVSIRASAEAGAEAGVEVGIAASAEAGAEAGPVRDANTGVEAGVGGGPDWGVALDVGASISRAISVVEAQLGGTPPTVTFASPRQHRDEQGMTHIRLQQYVQGIPVLGGEAIVHFNPDGSLFGVTSALGQAPLPLTPFRLDAAEAVVRAEAIDNRPGAYTAPTEVESWVVLLEGQWHPAYRVRMFQEDGTQWTGQPVVVIDGATGEVLEAYDDLRTVARVDEWRTAPRPMPGVAITPRPGFVRSQERSEPAAATPEEGQGSSLYSGEVVVSTSAYAGRFFMEDLMRRLGTFDMRRSTTDMMPLSDLNNVWSWQFQRAGLDVQYGMAETWDNYWTNFGREGMDGQGGPGYMESIDGSTSLITARIHYGKAYGNAFWNGSVLTFGDGDGDLYDPLVAVDIVAHEYTHGVIEYTAGLAYTLEPGAIAEAWADAMAVMVEHWEGAGSGAWWIGEDCYTPSQPGDALRYLDNPHAAVDADFTVDDDPDHYSERYTGSMDNGGIHINSGIANKAFYLLAVGGEHHLGGSMEGIGLDDAAAIWYKALEDFMISTTDFAAARAATVNAAIVLYGDGSLQRAAVEQAWTLVGVP